MSRHPSFQASHIEIRTHFAHYRDSVDRDPTNAADDNRKSTLPVVAEEPSRLHHLHYHNHGHRDHRNDSEQYNSHYQQLLGRSEALGFGDRDPEEVKKRMPIPTSVVPICRQRLVMVKIGDDFLRLSSGNKLAFSKRKPPLISPIEDDLTFYCLPLIRAAERKTRRQERKKPRGSKGFRYKDFTFIADESASITESWYRNARAFFNIRLGVQRPAVAVETDTEYLCAIRTPNSGYEVQLAKNTFGSWWRITAVSSSEYVAESVQFPGRCLMRDHIGLTLCPPITQQDRARIAKGKWDKARTITIYSLPDFAVWHPGVSVD